eukprot:CAMPEP_0181076566 /NCGR_PEP_ID=MMETSP1071-20121207/487_1 /TAXON_ID=35127 /ORGANISM="Thalassiosira sp., Strain NH16" /LENGTH=420 /DNA_ID=CAMNT_0023157755 /DNA_START=1788 /DNA_END=3050 /DNA_ORIENTATION=+
MTRTEKIEEVHNATSKHKDGLNDKTKAYRGVREVAFYEALNFASTLPSAIGSYSSVFQGVGTKSRIDDRIGWKENRQALMYLLSLWKHSSSPNKSATIQPFYASFLDSCRHPCTGYHHCRQPIKTEMSSSRSHMVLHGLNPLVNNFLSKFGFINYMAILVAYNTGDPMIVSSVHSYAQAWCALIQEVGSLKRLSTFTSPYFGAIDLEMLNQHSDPPKSWTQSLQKPHLLLRNLTTPFCKPNIIDIKMGTQTYEPAAPLSKQVREAGKYPSQSTIGFRIVGMRVYVESADGGEYRCWDKSFGISLKTRDDVVRALRTFFRCDGDVKYKSYTEHVIVCVFKQLTQIKSWFEEENTTLAFYASSALIVYDGDAGAQCGVASHNREPVLKMIDFAHVCRCSGGDEGYLKGIKSLLSILDEIQRS